MGYDFTGGRIFDFPIDFSMGLTTVQRYCAACDNRFRQQSPVWTPNYTVEKERKRERKTATNASGIIAQ